MKYLLTCLTFICTVGSLFAQTDGHLTFRDVPIDGNIDVFVKKMEDKGFTKVDSFEDGVQMEGRFIKNDCEVFIFCTPKSRITTRVTVYLPKDDSWVSLKSDYQRLKSQYNNKYGNYTDSYEFFSTPYYEGDGYETQALRNKKCSYLTLWELPQGIIAVQISEYCQISCTYEDKVNTNIAKIEKDSIIQDEI